MLVRIRVGRGPTLQRKRRTNRHVILAMSSLLTPVALMAFALAAWGLAAERGWMESFPISGGLLSRWPVWVAGGALLQLAAAALGRYGREH